MAMATKVVRKIVSTTNAPIPSYPYSQAVIVNNTMYISGQIGMDPVKKDLVPGGVEAECRQALANIGAILHAAGGDYKNVVKVTLLLADMADFATVNKIYGESNSKDYDDERLKYANLPFSAFKPPFPARAAYQVAALPRNCRIEIEAIAHLGDINDS